MDDMETPDTTSIWNKKPEDLTFGELCKANAALAAIMVGGMAVLAAAPVVVTSARDKFRGWRAARADKSNQDETPEEL